MSLWSPPAKSQLEASGVQLIDIYGIIGSNQINTLEHLGVEYKWSIYSPSKKSEILEAECSKDELCNIMTRLISSQIQYACLGYWVRMAPYGYMNQKVDTPHGKRTILIPHPTESKHIIEIFKLRATGQYTDQEITAKINAMGYCGRQKRKTALKRTTTRPENKIYLNTKTLWCLVRHPVYAGINNEKWTNGQPIKFVFDGLVTVELFNKANRGRRKIIENKDGKITIEDLKEKRYVSKGHRSAEFPFKKYVLCPHCEKPLLGSASRGRGGKLYPAYHCSKKNDHYFRVSKQELEEKIDAFFGRLKLSPESVDKILNSLESTWQQLETQHDERINRLNQHLTSLQSEISADLQKIKMLDSPLTIKYMEKDIARLEKEAVQVETEKQAVLLKKPYDIQRIRQKLKHMVEHMGETARQRMDGVKKARLFGLLFNQLPTYAQIAGGTASMPIFTGVNPIFLPKKEPLSRLAGETGFEPATFGFGDRCSKPAELLPYTTNYNSFIE